MHFLAQVHARLESLLGARLYRIARYLISGGTAAASNLGFLFILVQFFHLHYLPASVIAFILSVAVSFTMQKFWTFQDSALQNVRMQFGRYLIVLLINLALNTLLMYLFVEIGGLWYVLAQFFATAVVAVTSYIGYTYFVFKRKPEALP